MSGFSRCQRLVLYSWHITVPSVSSRQVEANPEGSAFASPVHCARATGASAKQPSTTTAKNDRVNLLNCISRFMESFLSFSRWVDHATAGLKRRKKTPREGFLCPTPDSDSFSDAQFGKNLGALSRQFPAIRTADSSSTNAVSFSSARTTKRFPSRCASTIQIVRSSRSRAETQPRLNSAFLRLSATTCQPFI